jgi:DNA-binding response OmpR family regulator
MNILNISTNPELLVIGTSYLCHLGFDVIAAHDLATVRELSRFVKKVDLVVLCHSLAEPEKHSISQFVRRRNPSARILELYLNEPDATYGTAIESVEFLPLMKTLARRAAPALAACC